MKLSAPAPTLVPSLALALALALALGGCIALPEAPDEVDDPVVDPPLDRVDGMTADVTYVDEVATCDSGSVQIPPGGFCATRTLDAVGRIGLDELPIDLDTVNGAIAISTGDGDSWSFHAVVKVRALTEDGARQGLNTTWSWTHEDGSGGHALKASPTPSAPAPADLQGLGATLEGASYTVVLPSWIDMSQVRARTTNGAVGITGRVGDVTVDTTNGAVALQLFPAASGAIHAATTNGAVTVVLVEDASHGYDLDASTTNGNIEIFLEDGDVTDASGDVGGKRKGFESDGFDAREIQTVVDLSTTNGAIVVSS